MAAAGPTNSRFRQRQILDRTPPPGCARLGSHEPFDDGTIVRLYPSRARNVAEVNRITDASLKAGFITEDGAAQAMKEAAQARFGATRLP